MFGKACLTLLLMVTCIAGAPAAQTSAQQSDSDQAKSRSIRDIPYAEHKGFSTRQTSLDLHIPQDCTSCPVLIFLHGGTWVLGDKKGGDSKIAMCNQAGWILANVNYRLSPEIEHPTHAFDVAEAVSWIHDNIEDYHGDPGRIVISGHSAGAHLAALIAVDPVYLNSQDKTPAVLAGVIGLDSAAYYLPDLIEAEPENRAVFEMAFGDQPERWRHASPVTHVGKTDMTPPFLLIYAGTRKVSETSTRALAEALLKIDVPVQLYHAQDRDHVSVERMIGQRGDETTDVIIEFLRQYER